MDVNKVERASLNKVKAKKNEPTDKTTFSEIMTQGRNQLTYEKLQKLMVKIEDQGKILAESRTVDEFRKFKSLIKEFMDDAVKYGLSLEERRGFNRRGRSKIYKVVQEVDKKLLDLTNAVIKQQEDSLQILDRIGEIKGLLINIYA
jgi:uncharacterized protein